MYNIKKGYLVAGENPTNEEELKEWKNSNLSFVEWTSEWFEKEIASTGDYVADNSDMCGGGDVLLFSTEKTAAKYGSRDAAIASGLNEITTCLFVDLSPIINAFSEEIRDDYLLSDIEQGQDEIISIFYDKNIIMFEDTPKGYELANMILEEISNLSTSKNVAD